MTSALWTPELEAWQNEDEAYQAKWDAMTEDEKRADLAALTPATVDAVARLAIRAAQETPSAVTPAAVKVHLADMRYVSLSENGDETTTPKVLSPVEAKWMKSTIIDEIGKAGVARLYHGETLQVDGHIVWLVDFGTDVIRDPRIEKRIADSHAASKARRTEIREFDYTEKAAAR